MKASHTIDRPRRALLRSCLAAATLLLLSPFRALAAIWNQAAFDASALPEALEWLAIRNEKTSTDIELIAPDMAENGAVVQVEVTSRIADTTSIIVLAEKNPTPLIAQFTFSNGALPYVVTRIKMAETCDVKVLVKAGDAYFTVSKRVEVLENGCG